MLASSFYVKLLLYRMKRKMAGMKMLFERDNEWIEWIMVLFIELIITSFIRTFLFAPIIVDGFSMFPTLHDQDKMLVNKINYHFSEPERFDIIVFHASDQKDFIKRIIGLPGEHVAVRDHTLYIDGIEVQEPFLNYKDEKGLIDEPTFYENFKLEELPGGYEKIPEDEYLVLGDNRNNSTDSRIIGLISKTQIVGKTNVIFRPIDRWQTMESYD